MTGSKTRRSTSMAPAALALGLLAIGCGPSATGAAPGGIAGGGGGAIEPTGTGGGGPFGAGGMPGSGGVGPCFLPIPAGVGKAGAATCSIQTPPVPTADVSRGASVEAAAEAEQMALLDLTIGRYLRGDAPVYRGSVTAHDNAIIFNDTPVPDPPANPSRTMQSDQAIASLQIGGDRTGDNVATLALFSACEHEHIFFSQNAGAPGTTSANGINDDNTYGGAVGTCSGCAADLFARPATIAWSDMDASVVTDVPDGSATFHVVSSVSLQVESPCDLTWDQLVALNASAPDGFASDIVGTFVKVGDEMVLAGWPASMTTAVPSGLGACDGQYVPYTIDLYVSLADLSHYGVRNFVAGTPQSYCHI